MLSACVELSPAGAQVHVLKEEQSAELTSCQLLGPVSVSSEDALRNTAAAMSGDTALMSVRELSGSSYIRGTIYRCKNEVSTSPAPTQAPIIHSTPIDEADIARKTARCREKGGVWSGTQCVIEIE